MINQNIGSFIAALRKEKGWTQEELAKKIGVSNRSISRWENGKTLPDYALLFVLAQELEISMAELITGRRSDTRNNQLDDIRLILELEHRESMLQRKQANQRFAFGFACLILSARNGPWGLFEDIPIHTQPILFWFCVTFGCFFVASGFYANRPRHQISQMEMNVLIADESKLCMKTAAEMQQFSKKNQQRHKVQHKRAFERIAASLRDQDYARFTFIADECTIDGNPGPWHISAALVGEQLLICGETMHGCLTPSFPVIIYQLGSLKAIRSAQNQLRLQFTDQEIMLRGAGLQAVAEQFPKYK
jgi:transcriptional regulator with XRE-family HTH domain